jgi:hypothetical protein
MAIARAAAALLMVVLVAACGAPAAVVPSPTAPPPTTAAPSATVAPSATPTAQPTVAPSPSPAAQPTASLAGPTPPPQAGGPLPAPLYVIDAATGQVARIERDGSTSTQITFEAEPVLELAVAARSGTLAYLVGKPEGPGTLVVLDGAGRRERLTEQISGLAISPDGERIAYRLDRPAPGLIVGRDDSPSGIWSSTPAGPGRPALVLADEPADGNDDPDAPAWSYAPLGFSPDGARLALVAYDLDGPAIPGGEVVILGPGPADLVRGPACCEQPVWSRDGAAIFSAGGGPGPDIRYGLFRVDAASGAETPLVEPSDDNTVPLVAAPFQPAGGPLLAFVELAPADGFSWEYPFRPRIARVEADGAVTPLSAPVPWPAAVLWRDDGSGAVTAPYTSRGALGSLAWVPADGGSVAPLAARGLPAGWVAAGAPLAAGDCANFAPVVYQQPAARRFDPAARDVQARLNALGFDAGLADGFFGDRTRAAVQAFQRERGLPETGDVDCATWQELLEGQG